MKKLLVILLATTLLALGAYLFQDRPTRADQRWRALVQALSGRQPTPPPRRARPAPVATPEVKLAAQPPPLPSAPTPVPAATPTPAPMPATTPDPNEPRLVLQSLSHSRDEWPRQVMLKRPLAFPAMIGGVVAGSVEVPTTALVNLVAVSGDKAVLSFQGASRAVSASDTDLIERVRENRRQGIIPNKPKPTATPVALVNEVAPAPNPKTKSEMDAVARAVKVSAAKPEIEFKVLLIIKRSSDTWHPLFLPIRSEMTAEDIAKARQCFEIQTPDMVHDITRGKVKFTPTVIVSDLPLRSFNPQRRDSAEYMGTELVNELANIAKPGDYDCAIYYFLYFDNASGYKIPRAGYGVGGFSGSDGIGMVGVGSASRMNPRDEIFLHEWMHTLDGYYGGKEGVRLPKGALHGMGNYDAHYKEAKAWRPQDTFRGYMEWYKDIFTCQVPEGDGFAGYGDAAWKHGPMRDEAKKKARKFPTTPLPKGEYPQWVYELMKGNSKNAQLGTTLLPADLKPAEIAKDGQPWRLDSWSGSAKTTARYSPGEGGTFTLDCDAGNHASIRCDAPLEPFSNYVFTAEVKTAQVKIEQAGGKHSVLLAAGDSQSTRDLSGSVDWTPIVLPFTTKPDQSSATVRLQIGGPGSLASGRATFRNVKLQKVGYPTP